MDIFERFKRATLEDENAFKAFIASELENDSQLLHKTFWNNDGEQITLLNYLIQNHSDATDLDTKINLKSHIKHLLSYKADIMFAQPVHLALKLKKFDLVELLLRAASPVFAREYKEKRKEGEAEPSKDFINGRDIEGYTLLYRAIQADNINILKLILEHGPNVNESNRLSIPSLGMIDAQPLHQAIAANDGKGIHVLIQAGAQVDNPVGPTKKTPLLLATSLGQINALEALLETVNQQEQLEIEDTTGDSAMILLCKHLKNSEHRDDALRGIAMLLCHGVQAPASSEMGWHLLQKHRQTLIEHVTSYTYKHPELAPKFYRIAHDMNSSLHGILYKDSIWTRAFSHLFGKVNPTAERVEEIVENQNGYVQDDEISSSSEDKNFTGNEVKFAEFVKLYNQTYRKAFLSNPWSEMRWEIAMGEMNTWDEVYRYAQTHKNSRTAQVVNSMTDNDGNFHEEDNDMLITESP